MTNKDIRFIIDEGNTRTKIAAYQENDWLFFDTIKTISEDFLTKILQEADIHYSDKLPKAIFSSVRKHDIQKKKLLSRFLDVLYFSHKTPLPIKSYYETPETLGLDRLASVVGASGLFKKQDLLVIDAGTCITYDFIDKQNNYHGGGIMPGLQMKLQALHTFTDNLPLLSLELSSDLYGKNTRDAILAGAVNVSLLALDAIIDRFRQQCPLLRVILCGGDVKVLHDNLKNDTFAEPKLVLYGLKQILDFNEDS